MGDAGLLKYVEVAGDGEAVDSGAVLARVRCHTTTGLVFEAWDPPIEVAVGVAALSATSPLIELVDRSKVAVTVLEESIRTALAEMLPGERAVCSVAPTYGFGGDGCPELGVPPDTALGIELELVSVGRRDTVRPPISARSIDPYGIFFGRVLRNSSDLDDGSWATTGRRRP